MLENFRYYVIFNCIKLIVFRGLCIMVILRVFLLEIKLKIYCISKKKKSMNCYKKCFLG